MRSLIHIAVILWLSFMAACNPKSEVERAKEQPCHVLEEIDSLMWEQPDSAFALLQAFAASPEADSLDEYNGHYCQLLVSELLYKNYYEQSNREELLKAVDYFDSIRCRGELNASAIVFLNARAHYINGTEGQKVAETSGRSNGSRTAYSSDGASRYIWTTKTKESGNS